MAVVFELVVNFPEVAQDEIAQAASVAEKSTVTVRGAEVPLAGPMISTFSDYVEFSVVVAGIGYGGPPAELPFNPRDLTVSELTACASQMYDLLRRFRSFDIAMVGWDPEEHVNPAELADEWIADGELERLDGLVVSDVFKDAWDQFAPWESFDHGHWWIPLQERRSPWRPGG